MSGHSDDINKQTNMTHDSQNVSTGEPSLVDRFEVTCARFADQPAFHCLGQALNFRDLEAQSRAFAGFLRGHLGLAAGERVAIQLPNILSYPLAAWGAARAGLILVNTNPLYTERELVHQLNDAGVKVLVALARSAEALQCMLPQTQVEHVVFVPMAEGEDARACEAIDASATTFGNAQRLGRETGFNLPRVAMDDVLALQYTGGTTGVSKGAVLTHGNMYNAVRQVDDTVGIFEDGVEVFLAPLPLYHVYGFNTHIVGNVLRGGLSVLIPDPRYPDALIAALKSFAVTAIPGINTLFAAMLHHPCFKDADFSRLKLCTAGGAALLTDLAMRWERATGCCMTEGYGMSETCGVATFNVPGRQQIGSIGQPVADTQLKVVDDQGLPVANGIEGELLIKGPQVMRGYWQQPRATQEAFDGEGWLRSGDVAVIQDDGYVRLVDRKKDMVIVSGFNVYPNEVENVASGHEGVLECAAIGVPDDRSGEAVMLFVIRTDPTLTEEDIRDFCRRYLTAYKVPRHVRFVDALPKSNVGKILRRELRTQTSSPAAA